VRSLLQNIYQNVLTVVSFLVGKARQTKPLSTPVTLRLSIRTSQPFTSLEPSMALALSTSVLPGPFMALALGLSAPLGPSLALLRSSVLLWSLDLGQLPLAQDCCACDCVFPCLQ
jgi:hypothetical protein